MRTEVKTHCAGTNAEFYVLRVFKADGSILRVHTSKSRAYIRLTRSRYEVKK